MVGGDRGVFALVMDFKKVMLTSPPELAHCGGGELKGVGGVYWSIGGRVVNWGRVGKGVCIGHRSFGSCAIARKSRFMSRTGKQEFGGASRSRRFSITHRLSYSA